MKVFNERIKNSAEKWEQELRKVPVHNGEEMNALYVM